LNGIGSATRLVSQSFDNQGYKHPAAMGPLADSAGIRAIQKRTSECPKPSIAIAHHHAKISAKANMPDHRAGMFPSACNVAIYKKSPQLIGCDIFDCGI
jgi:hypothetical protein